MRPPPRNQIAFIAALGLLFIVSGASALVVEQVFEKLLLTVVGSATKAGAVVIAVFFLGLTAGGALYARYLERATRILLVLVGLEVAVGSSGVLLGALFSPLQSASYAVIRLAGEDEALVLAARLFLSVVWMAVPTIAMGATYPAMLGALRRCRGRSSSPLAGLFYSLNLLGALLGAVLGPYVAFRALGLCGALLRVALVQIGMASLALALGYALGFGRLEPPGEDAAAPSRSTTLWPEGRRTLLLLSALSGFLVFSLEVVWYHLIGAVLGMSAYAFAAMLAVVLLSLFAGSSLVSLVSIRLGPGNRILPVVLCAASLSLFASLSAWDKIPDELSYGGAAVRSFADGELLRFTLSAWVVGAPCVFVGMIYPSLLQTTWFRGPGQDRLAGLLGAFNSIGCVAGSLGAAFVALGTAGAERTLAGLALFCGAGAVLCATPRLFWAGSTPPSRRQIALSSALGVVMAALVVGAYMRRGAWDRLRLTSGIHVYFRPVHVREGSALKFWHEDAEGGFVTVVERSFQGVPVRTLLTNGKFQGNDGGEVAAQVAFALLPCLATSGRARAMVIGYGTGQSAEVIASAGFKNVDIAEISRGIVRAADAEFPHIIRGARDRPGVRLFYEDGRNHLVRTRARYDVISIEITSVWFAGATSLYSSEFYDIVRQRLAEGGVLQQWIQLHHLELSEVRSILATLRRAFPFVALWYIGDQGIILASERPIALDPERLDDPRADLSHDLAALKTAPGSTQRPWERLLLDASDVDRLASSGDPIINTDSNRWLELSTPRYTHRDDLTPEHMARALLAFVPEAERARRARMVLATEAP